MRQSGSQWMLSKAVFWDRDGVINDIRVENGVSLSPRKFEDFKLNKDIHKIMNKISNLGYKNFVVTNQPDISRGLMDLKELEKMNKYLLSNLPIDEIYFCPHDNKDDCNCRKPKAGMFLEALNKYKLDTFECFVVGDRITDLIAAKKAKIKSLFLLERNYSLRGYENQNNCTEYYKINELKDLNSFF